MRRQREEDEGGGHGGCGAGGEPGKQRCGVLACSPACNLPAWAWLPHSHKPRTHSKTGTDPSTDHECVQTSTLTPPGSLRANRRRAAPCRA